MDTLIKDFRYAVRNLMKSRGFSTVALLTLALGIGANTAMFSVVNAVLLRPLPFDQPDRLMAIITMNSRRGTPAPNSVSYPDYFDYRDQNRTFEGIASYNGNNFSMTGNGEATLLRGQVVGAALFRILRVQPALGRDFRPEEDQAGHHVAIISNALWKTRFNGDRGAIGRTVDLSGKAYTIIGVAPEGFQFPVQADPTDIWVTIAKDADVDDPGDKPVTTQRGAHFLTLIGRLKPGVTREQAAADLTAIAQNLSKQFPDTNTYNTSVRVEDFLKNLIGDTRTPLLMLLGAVGCVLLIACVNVANLVLARSSSRSREIAIRAALGATRGRIVRQLMTESIVLALGGAILGAAIASWAVSAVVQLYPQNLPRAQQIGIDPRVLLFTAALAIVTGLLFGLFPSLHASRADLNEAMREGGRGSVGDARQGRVRSALVVAETALGVMLLIGAGLLIRSLERLSHVDLGFSPDHLLTANFDINQTRYNSDRQDRFYAELLDRVRALPGVVAASATGQMPLANDGWSISFDIVERRLPKSQQPSAGFYDVYPGFFEAMRIPVLQGRSFDAHDTRDSKPVVVVNRAFAERYFPNENPLGKMIEIGAGDGKGRERWRTREIVGVAGNIRSSNLDQLPQPAYFVPMPQLVWGPPTLAIRTAGDPMSIVSALHKTLADMDPDAPLYDVKSLDDYLALDLGRARFQATLLGLFGGVALLLTAIGLYGVIAYAVVQRTHEIGVRMALGASRGDVLRMIVRRGLVLTVAGVGIGVGGALGLARLIQSMLYEIPPRDPVTYVAVCVTLAAVALLASYVPALRASRVDPMVALRYE